MDTFTSMTTYTYEVIYRRFILLAVMRYYRTPEDVIRKVLLRPYFAQPFDRLLGILRRGSLCAWSKVGRDGWSPRRGWTEGLECEFSTVDLACLSARR
jgi:hypothetical protein